MSLVIPLLGALRASLRTRTDLALENLALRQQLVLLRRSKRPQFGLWRIKELMEVLGWQDRHKAYLALRAGLHALDSRWRTWRTSERSCRCWSAASTTKAGTSI